MSATGVSTKSMAVPEIAIMEDVVGGAARHVWAQPQHRRGVAGCSAGALERAVQRRSGGAGVGCVVRGGAVSEWVQRRSGGGAVRGAARAGRGYRRGCGERGCGERR